jgi:hypothetical protein
MPTCAAIRASEHRPLDRNLGQLPDVTPDTLSKKNLGVLETEQRVPEKNIEMAKDVVQRHQNHKEDAGCDAPMGSLT